VFFFLVCCSVILGVVVRIGIEYVVTVYSLDISGLFVQDCYKVLGFNKKLGTVNEVTLVGK